jgi:murein L,D-transpeptidase YcbB/YkuD
MENKSRLERATEWAEQIIAGTAASDPEKVVVLDSRRRVSLAKLNPVHIYYRASKLPDGTIVLRPGAVLNKR